MIKYITPHTKEDEYAHFEYCKKNKHPFITIKQKGKQYSEIFYDVTNSNLCLDSISKVVKEFYLAYIEFAHIPKYEIQDCLDNIYQFELLVNKNDSDFIASRLFDFLMVELKNKA